MNNNGWQIVTDAGMSTRSMRVVERESGTARASWLAVLGRCMAGVTVVLLLIGVAGCKTGRQSRQADTRYGQNTHPIESPHAASAPAAVADDAKGTNGVASTEAAVSGATNSPSAAEASVSSKSLVLKEGDVVKISFPAAPNLDTIQQIRQDGKISLKLVGEFKAAGLTPSDMEKELVKRYEKELSTPEVTVTVESSAYPIYLTGAIMRPGKIMCDRPLTALEAVMEAGVDYSKSNLKKVVVIRHEKGKVLRFPLNLKAELQGTPVPSFELKTGDIIFVPERFSWF